MIQQDAISILKQIPKKNSNRIFLIDSITKKQISFRDLDEKAKAIGKILQDSGFKKGDRISLLLDNSIPTVYFYFGCLYSGISVVPINSVLTTDEINHIINNSNSKGVVLNENTKNKFNLKFLKKKIIKIYLEEHEVNEKYPIHALHININMLKISKEFTPFQNVTQNDEMCVVYSAGTTSQPKDISHTIKDLVHNAQSFGKIMKINEKNRFYNILSLMYLGGYYNLLILPYILNSSVVLINEFDPKLAMSFWEPVIKNSVNTLWLVPSIMSMLLELDRLKKGKIYCKKNICLTLCGTAPLPKAVQLSFEKKYNVKIHENYGLSETLFISTKSPQNKISKEGVGKILPNIKIKILDKYGKEVTRGKEGEIVIKTPYLTKNNHNKKSKKHSENWFETGDIGKVDGENLIITNRKKDIIIRGGINISPANIENLFYKNRHILECAVIGIPDKFQGEKIVAVIRINENKNFEKIRDDLNISCKKNLSSIEQPSRIVNLTQFPHATYGKIQKNKIRSWLENSNQINKSKILLKKRKLKQKKFTLSKIATNSIEATSIRYNTKVYEKQQKGEDVIVMSLGEAFFEIPLFNFNDLPFPKIYHYSHSKGIPELRQKLAKYFLEMYDVSFDFKHEILITAGSKIGIYMCLMAVLDPGDDVLVHEPAWVSYPEQIKLAHGNPIRIPMDKSIYDFEDYITSKTKLIIINNPNNPTGKLYDLEEISFLYNLAKKYNLYILSDEAYSDFVDNQDDFISFSNLDTTKKNSIIVNSISKNFGISGWRLGYIITNKILIDEILKINQHLITCPPTILEYYIEKHFDEIIKITKPQISKLIAKRKHIAQFMNVNNLKYLPGNTTFYFFVSIADSKLNSEEFCSQLLHKYHVSAVPGIGYGDSCDNFIRISIGSESIQRIKKGLDLINKLIKLSLF